MPKVVIEDLVLRFEGGKEKELLSDTRIRFELGSTEITVMIGKEGDCLCLDKVERDGRKETRLTTLAEASNRITIK